MREESGLLARVQAGDLAGAAQEAFARYGAEIYGFLVNLLGTESDATKAFLQVGEDVWRGLPGFAARSSVRTWLYVLARNAATDYRRSPWNRRERRASEPQLGDILVHTRTATAPWLRTDIKERVRALRESLSVEDRAILVLRVDRQLSWDDVARITLGNDAPDAPGHAREVARVTKRYQLIKEQLKKRARAAGLVGEDDA